MDRPAIVCEVVAPMDVASAFDVIKDRPYAFFLDSGMGPANLGRYSFIGCDPFLVLKSKGGRLSVAPPGGEKWEEGNPFERLRMLLSRYWVDAPGSPVPLNGGAVGYLSYDLCHWVERLPATAVDDLDLPECVLGFYDVTVAFDNLTGRSHIVSTGFPEADEKKRLVRAGERMDEAHHLLSRALRMKGEHFFEPPDARVRLRSNFAPDEYLAAVRQAREYIIAGDIFQVNLSQRFEADLAVSPYELYRRLRAANPAPFACYLDMDDVVVAGSSPERFLRLRGRTVETRPIKGTRPRGQDASADEALARELLASYKDRAENVMIVDLERNDLGRVCKFGSVRVKELAALETFPTVFHLTSTVVGELRGGTDRVDLLYATFPGGSITGAPKVRSMEIIDELEPTRRSVYTGAIGYMSFSGEMDLNIVIRTFLIKGKKAYFQVGGGIVYDSRPDDEYEETLHKAKGLISALKLAPRSAVEVA